jgi:hypothetical protein
MAYSSLACNPSCFDPPFDAFVKNGLVEDIFSICMTATGGKLMLGGFTPSVARSPVKYVPLYLSDPPRYYRVRLTGSLKIGDEMVSMPNFKTAIVDTGTTLIVTSTRTFATLREHFQAKYCIVPELCGEDSWFQSGMCVSLSKQDMANLPTLTLNLEAGLDLELRPEDYMLKYIRGVKTYRWQVVASALGAPRARTAASSPADRPLPSPLHFLFSPTALGSWAWTGSGGWSCWETR